MRDRVRDRLFLDTNVLLRFFLDDIPHQSAAAARLMGRVVTGDVVVVISSTVLLEVVYVLEKRRHLPRLEIRQKLMTLIELSSVELDERGLYVEVFRRYVERSSLSFADCYHIVLARKLAGGCLVTFDRVAGRSEGIEWIEPT